MFSALVTDRLCKGRYIARLKERIQVFYKHELRSLAELYGAVALTLHLPGFSLGREIQAIQEERFWLPLANLPPPFFAISSDKVVSSCSGLSAPYRLAGSFGVSSAIVTLGLFSGLAYALPQGYESVEGNIQFQQSGNTLNISTQAHKSIAQYQQFNVGQGETVNFNLPNAQSAILNRVVGPDASQIMGKINSNGQVFLTNPNGIVFGQGAQVNVAGLLASTLSISNPDFMAGQYTFKQEAGKGSAKVQNDGSITVDKFALLAGGAVENTGTISATDSGSINLAVGKQLSVAVDQNLSIAVTVDESLQAEVQGAQSAISNSGTLSANGGAVQAQARLAQGLYERSINNTGHIEAKGLGDLTGEVVLQADKGLVVQAGTIDVGNQTGKGGNITVLGESIRLTEGSVTDASGQTGGGQILIGGDYQGQGTLPHAKDVVVDSGSTIKANATNSGNGGKVILWSDEKTWFGGRIEAKGGAISGDGGLVETSAKGQLGVWGQVDASAVNGKGGEWLLDPSDVVLVQGTGNSVPGGGGTVDPSTDTYQIDTNSIQAALNAGNSVTITTANGSGTQAGNITTSGTISINKTSGGDATLTLKADNSISLSNTTITSTSGKLHTVLWSDSDNSSAGAISLTSSSITSNSGDIVLAGGLDTNADGRPDGYAWGTAANNNGVILNNGDLNSLTGTINIKGHGYNGAGLTYQRGIIAYNDSRLQSTSGNIILSGIGGNGSANNYGINLSGVGTFISSSEGHITLTGIGGNGTGDSNYGISLDNQANVTNTGLGITPGSITLHGTGGSGAGSYNIGVALQSDADIISSGSGSQAAAITVTGLAGSGVNTNYGVLIRNNGSTITSIDGDITLAGVGGNGTGGVNRGIELDYNGLVVSSGLGNITLTGTGGSATSGYASGVNIEAFGAVQGTLGNITITGMATDTGILSDGIVTWNTSSITTTGPNATITLNGSSAANRWDINYLNTGSHTIGNGSTQGNIVVIADKFELTNLNIQTSGNIIIKPRTASTHINIMTGSSGTGALNLSSTYLGYFNPGNKLVIGDSAAGTGTVTIGAWDLTGKTYGVEVYGGTVDFTGAIQWNQANNLLFHSRTGDLAIDQTFTKSGGGTSTLTFKAGNTITQTSNITSSSGILNTILWSDSDNSGAGAIVLTNASITSNGGDIILGGGLDDGSNGGIAADGRPDNDARGTATNVAGITMNGSLITATTGNTTLLGHGYNNASGTNQYGIYQYNNARIISTSGSIRMIGTGGNGTSSNHGILLGNGPSTRTYLSTTSGNISLTGTGQGSGANNFGVFVDSNIVIQTTDAGSGGNITFNGTGGNGTDDNYGLHFAYHTQVNTVGGDITLTGTGRGSGTANHGVYGYYHPIISSAGTGADAGDITIVGVGANGSGSNYGVIYDGANVGTPKISAVDGSISIAGQGGASSGGNNYGIYLQRGMDIISEGMGGDITLTGTGGNGSNNNYGIYIKDSGTSITSINSNISLTGQGGGSGSSNYGIRVASQAYIQSTGSGAVTLFGTGANGTDNNYGININNTGTGISAANGSIRLVGTGGNGSSNQNHGINIDSDADIISTGLASITLTGTRNGSLMTSTYDIRVTGATIQIGGPSAQGNITFVADLTNPFLDLNVQTAGSIILKPRTAATSIGIMGGAGTLGFLSAYMNSFNPGNKLIIGDASAGTGTVTIGAWDLTGKTYGVEVYGGTVDFTGAIQWNQANNLLFHSRTGGLAIDQAFAKSGGGTSILTFKAAGNLTQSNTITSTSGMLNTIYWSDADNSGTGYVRLGNTTLQTNGGDVVIAGGADDGSNGGIAADGRPDGYAWGGSSISNGVELTNFNVNTGIGNIVIRGKGELSANPNRNGVDLNTGTQLTTTTGNISITGQGGGTTTIHNYGVWIRGASTVIQTVSGHISITGTGGAGTNNDNYGIMLGSGAQIYSTGTGVAAGNILLTGTGGGNNTSRNYGIYLDNSGTMISTVDGDITLTGQGGAGGSGYGIRMRGGASITSTGTGASAGQITLQGTAGSGGINAIGIEFADANTAITSVDGAITITGQGGAGTASSNYGLTLGYQNPVIRSTGTGSFAAPITITGTGGNGTGNDIGINLGTVVIDSIDGDIILNGQGGLTGSGSIGINVGWGTNLASLGTGLGAAQITLNGTGGSGTNLNHGVHIDNNNLSTPQVTSLVGNIIINAQGGPGGSGIFGQFGGKIASLGTGANAANILITASGDAEGVRLQHDGTQITTVDGDIIVNATSSNNIGVTLYVGGMFASTGTGSQAGNISITTSSSVTHGFYAAASATGSGISTVDGNVSITATGQANALLFSNALGVTASGSGNIILAGHDMTGTADIYANTGNILFGGSSASGNITLIADRLNLANLSVQTSGNITIKPRTASTSIGIMGGVGTLNLSSTYLGYFNPGNKLIIGDSVAGTGTVTIGAWDLTGKTYGVEVYGGTVDFAGAVQWNQANSLLFHSRTGDLAIDQTFTKSGGGTSTLTFKAGNTITQTQNITSSSGALNTILWSDSDNSVAGAIALTNASITSNGGDIHLAGGLDDGANGGTTGDGRPDGYAWGTASNDDGVVFDNTDLTSTSGNIIIRGKGRNDAAISNLYGVFLANGSQIITNNGNLTLFGTGGAGTHSNYGIFLAGADTIISSANGNVTVSGQGGNGSSNFNIGIFLLNGGKITSTGNAILNLAGTGGSGTSSNYGILINGTDTSITSINGNVTITGQGGNGSSSNNIGLYLTNGGQITSTGNAILNVAGTGGNGTIDNYGVYLVGSNSWISSVNGDVIVTGQGGNGSSYGNAGLFLNNGGQIISTGTALLTLSGTGGTGTSNNHGVLVSGNNTRISSANGDVFVTGQGGNSSSDVNIGIYLTEGGQITSTGNAMLTLSGTGGAGTGYNYGAFLYGTNTRITSVSGNVTITGQGGGGTGNIGLYLGTSTNITSTGVGAGASNITLIGIGGGTGGASNGNNGIHLHSSTINVVDGDLTITGTAGIGSSLGIYMAASTIQATGTGINAGTITLTGFGGSTGQGNYGILFDSIGSGLLTIDSDIVINGTGGGDGTGLWSMGVYLYNNSRIISTGTGAYAGNITITGNAGNGTGGSVGVGLGNGTMNAVTTVDGDITITGTGGMGNANNYGFMLGSSADIISTGTNASAGNITITGIGGSGTGSNYGILVGDSGSTLSSVDGAIILIGMGGSGASGINNGIQINTDADILSSGSGTISVTGTRGDSLAGTYDISIMGATITIGGAAATGDQIYTADYLLIGNTNAQTTGSITIKPRTASTSIGIVGGAGTLSLSSALLSQFNPGNKLIIGDSTAGTGTVTIDAWDLTGKAYGVEVYGGTVDFTGAVQWNQANNLLFHSRTGDLAIDQTFTKSGGGSSTLTFKAGNTITQTANISSSSGALNTVLWSDADNSGAGAIALINASITSNGGDIILGGGLDDGANGGTTGDGRPDGYAWGTATNDDGVVLSNSDLNSTTGHILLRGHGRDDSATTRQYGVHVVTGSMLQSTVGNITLDGIGGNGNHFNYGVLLTGAGSGITTSQGNIIVTGRGGNNSDTNIGIYVRGAAVVSSTDTGRITFIGTGGNGLSGNSGIRVEGSGSLITTLNGNINFIGQGSGTDSYNNGILLYLGGSVITSGAGHINLTGTGANGTSNNVGIIIQESGSSISSLNSGSITLIGQGGHGVTENNFGIRLLTGGSISSAGIGEINLTGTGGNGTNGNRGIFIQDTGTTIASAEGAITLTGQGNGSGSGNEGIHLNTGGRIVSTGTGANAAPITLIGTAGLGTFNLNGIYIRGEITTTDGDIQLTGQGSTSTNSINIGVYVSSGLIRSIGTTSDAGTITITGTGAAGVGSANHGVAVQSGGIVSSIAGDISITGTAGNASSGSNGITLWNSGSILSTGSADITLTGHAGVSSQGIRAYNTGNNIIGDAGMSGNITLIADSYSFSNLQVQTAGSITFRPHTLSLSLGFNGGAGSLGFDNTFLSLIDTSVVSPSKVILGDAASGSGVATIAGLWNLAGYAFPLEIHAGSITSGSISLGSSSLLLKALTGDITLNSGAVLSSNHSGTGLVLASVTGSFINNAGSGALSTPNGRWLIYTDNPTDTVEGGLTYNKRYGIDYGDNVSAYSSGNYIFYSISPTLTVTAENKSKTYGSANPTFTSVITGFIDGDTLGSAVSGSASYTTSATATSNVGNYTLSTGIGSLASDLGYTFTTFVDGNLEVTKASLTVTADDKSKVYGSANPALTATYTGFVLGQDASVLDTLATLSTSATATSNVGNYAITAASALDNNYSFTYVDGNLEVTKASLTVTADNKSKVYGSANPGLTATYTGFVLGEDASVLDSLATLSTSATRTSEAGRYAITVSGAMDSNYAFTYVEGSLTVLPTAAIAASDVQVLLSQWQAHPTQVDLLLMNRILDENRGAQGLSYRYIEPQNNRMHPYLETRLLAQGTLDLGTTNHPSLGLWLSTQPYRDNAMTGLPGMIPQADIIDTLQPEQKVPLILQKDDLGWHIVPPEPQSSDRKAQLVN